MLSAWSASLASTPTFDEKAFDTALHEMLTEMRTGETTLVALAPLVNVDLDVDRPVELDSGVAIRPVTVAELEQWLNEDGGRGPLVERGLRGVHAVIQFRHTDRWRTREEQGDKERAMTDAADRSIARLRSEGEATRSAIADGVIALQLACDCRAETLLLEDRPVGVYGSSTGNVTPRRRNHCTASSSRWSSK